MRKPVSLIRYVDASVCKGTHKSGANQSTSTDRNPNMEAGILSSRGLDLKDDIAIAIVCVELRA
jgi:hypothetical protein